jgi:hypothetical protein
LSPVQVMKMIFKIGDKVKVLRASGCPYEGNCDSCPINLEAVIFSDKEEDGKFTVSFIDPSDGKPNRCRFKEEDMELFKVNNWREEMSR